MLKKFKVSCMMVIVVLSVMSMLNVALAQSIEEDVFAVIRVSNPGDTITQVGQFVEQIQPGMSAMINSMMVGQMVFQNPAWAGMDLAGEYTAVVLNPMKYLMAPFALVFPVNNKDAYLTALSQSLTGGEEVEGVYTFTQANQQQMFVTFSGDKGLFSQDMSVLEAVKGLVVENSPLLQEHAVVKGQLVAFVAVDKILTATRPMIEGLKEQMMMGLEGMPAPEGDEGAQPEALKGVVNEEANALLSFLDQVKKLQLGVTVDPEGVRVMDAVFPTSGGSFAKFIAAQAPKKAELLGLLPADSGILMSGAMELTPEFKDWYAGFLTSMNTVAGTDPATGDQIAQWVMDTFDAFGGEFVLGGLSHGEETLFTTIYRLKDASKAKELVEQYPEMIGTMMEMYKGMGVELDMQLTGKTPYQDGEIFNFDLGFDVASIPDPEGQEVFQKVFGEGLMMPIGFVKNYSVLGLGKNAQTEVQNVMEQLDSGAAGAAQHTPAAFGLPEENNLYLYVAVPKMLKWVANYAPDAPPIEIAESPGMALTGRFVESRYEGEMFVPAAEVLAIMTVVQQAQQPPMQ